MAKNPGKKTLRSTSNAIKDLYNTYVKNEEREIPITDEENENAEENMQDELNQEEMGEDFASPEEMHEQMIALVDQMNELGKERDELKDALVRKVAELENLRKRSIREKQEMIEYANERLLFRFLELLDDMSNAVDAGKKSDDYATLLQGLEMIHSKAVKFFEDNGVKRMEDAVGKEFNVDYHEAMMHTPHPEIGEGCVVQVIQPGYMMHEKVLRHARVITSAGKPQATEDN
jgi:molecular chaperone GrpE